MTLHKALLTLLRRYERRQNHAEAAGNHDDAELFESRRQRVSGLLSERERRSRQAEGRWRREAGDAGQHLYGDDC
jgi:hypothetical protein